MANSSLMLSEVADSIERALRVNYEVGDRKLVEISLMLRFGVRVHSFGFVVALRTMAGRTGWWDLGTRRMLLHHRLRVASTGCAAMLLWELMMLLW
jgi:hypothetical protein